MEDRENKEIRDILEMDERKESAPKEKVDWKKAVIFSEILKPKFDD